MFFFFAAPRGHSKTFPGLLLRVFSWHITTLHVVCTADANGVPFKHRPALLRLVLGACHKSQWEVPVYVKQELHNRSSKRAGTKTFRNILSSYFVYKIVIHKFLGNNPSSRLFLLPNRRPKSDQRNSHHCPEWANGVIERRWCLECAGGPTQLRQVYLHIVVAKKLLRNCLWQRACAVKTHSVSRMLIVCHLGLPAYPLVCHYVWISFLSTGDPRQLPASQLRVSYHNQLASTKTQGKKIDRPKKRGTICHNLSEILQKQKRNCTKHLGSCGMQVYRLMCAANCRHYIWTWKRPPMSQNIHSCCVQVPIGPAS